MPTTYNAPDALGRIATQTLTITNGTSLSPALDLQGFSLVGLVMPSGWTAANLTMQGSADGVTFGDLWDDTAEYTIVSAAASRLLLLDPIKFLPLRALKLRSGTAGTPVNQGADRIITVMLRGMGP